MVAATAAVAELQEEAAAIPEAEVIPAVIRAAVVIQVEVVIPVADIEVEAIPAAVEAEDMAAVAAEGRECPALFSMTPCFLVLTS